MKKAGILCPISSLPSDYGIGDFGKNSYLFIDKIAKIGFRVWQILPLNALGYGNSPYQPYSSKAMDELYVALDLLCDMGLLNDVPSFNKDATDVDYDAVRAFKQPYLYQAYKNYIPDNDYHKFINDNPWVYQYSVFLTLRKKNNNQCWNLWNKQDKEWIKQQQPLPEYEDEINYQIFIQYILVKQWKKLKSYANKHNIQIMGDMPFYVGLDSLDVYANQDSFLLDENGEPTFIAGVPPDYFSETGQRWGNPIYNWDKFKADDFAFWRDRIGYNMNLFDILRIDHFRAFDTYWKIPATCPTAVEGDWIEAPGYEFFDTLFNYYPQLKLVAEDLGDLRPQVYQLRDHYRLAGMRIIQFSLEPKAKKYMSMDKYNLIAYTGTHDNDSLRTWYKGFSDKEKRLAVRWLKEHGYDNRNFNTNIINYLLQSKSKLVILSIIDMLHQDRRINTPGTLGNPNWQYKLKDFSLFDSKSTSTRKQLIQANRI